MGIQENIQIETQARYIRIQILGTATLHMAEVQVMGCMEENLLNLMANLNLISTNHKNNYVDLNLTLFPNPTKDIIQYDIKNAKQTDWDVQIFDFSNQNVLNLKNKDNQGIINVTHLSNGFYTVIFKSSEGLISSIFIVLK
ncbi:MAG: hypothetical protein ACJA1P_000023 [Maribacter sp.]